MKRNNHRHFTTTKTLSALTFLPAMTAVASAQQEPFLQAGTAQPPLPVAAAPRGTSATMASPPPGTGANSVAAKNTGVLGKFFNGRIPDALANGKFNLDVRLRYEQEDEDGVPAITKNSYAPTVRTRFGYTTAPLYGFQGMLEGANISVLGPEHNYNAAGSNGQGARPNIADPPLTRLDQAWLGYSYANYFKAKVGEQQINLDNQRFIGDVNWRQNMQTFDAASAGSEPIKNLDLYYAYVWDVHRVFGNVGGLPPAFTDFDSRSHLINAAYSGWKYGRFVGYTYLLDLQNAAGAANSCATYGGYFAGEAPVDDRVALDYRAEFAWQTDYADSPLRYGTGYYNLEGGVRVRPFAFGAGYEDLGSAVNDAAPAGPRAAFRTPLATLHAFNGWAEIFLTPPADGLRDLYGYAQVTLPGQIPLRLVYHKFDADYGSANYGQEFDLVATKKFGKHWTALVEFADYLGEDAIAFTLSPSLPANVNVQRVWAQMEFNF